MYKLVVIDIQKKLFNAMDMLYRESFLKYSKSMIYLFNALELPIVFSEQYPEGLGETLQDIMPEGKTKHDYSCIVKNYFDLTRVDKFKSELSSSKEVIPVLIGMEAHICVYLTATGLIKAGFKPVILEDCILSRSNVYKKNAMRSLSRMPVSILNAETLGFKLLQHSKSEFFRDFSRLIR
jgi:hypothetical protein